MDGLGAGDFIAWVADMLGALLRGPSWPALPLAYLTYGLLVAGVLSITRKAWRVHTDRWLALRRPLQHIWGTYRRRPRIVWSLSWRLFRESAWPLAPVLSLVQSLLWTVAVWAAVVPWQDRGFRNRVDQIPPSLFGQPLGASGLLDGAWLTWSWTGFIAWVLLLSTYRQVKARSARRRWMLGLMPPGGSGLPAVASVIGVGVLTWLLMGWIPNLPLPWLVTILGCTLLPAQWAAWRQDRRRRPIDIRIPEWVWGPPVPAQAPEIRRPQVPPTKVIAAADHAATPTFASVESQRVRLPAPTLVAPVPTRAEPVFAQAPGVLTAPKASPTPYRSDRQERLPNSWADLAPAPRELAEHEPRFIASYRILGRIGSGGMANVYLAETPRGSRIALKVSNPLSTIADANVRMLAEIRTLARVSDPAVVEIHDAGMVGDQPYLAMDYLQGPTLHAAVARNGGLTAGALRSLATTLASGLAAIHRVGVHRDIKPANIILTDSGPVIVDLGIAKLSNMSAEITRVGTTLGTVGYTAPEVLHGDEATAASDVFAWGACLAFAGTNKPLFGSGSLEVQLAAVRAGDRDRLVMSRLSGADERLARLITRATAPSPLVRPVDGAALLELLPAASRWPVPAKAFASA